MVNIQQESDIYSAVESLQAGKVLVYPTESMYGLGCDPFNESAVGRLLSLKKRSKEEGLILIAANWMQVEQLIQPITNELREEINASWPGNKTWIFTKSALVPNWISGQHSTVALRVPDHPVALLLCELFKGPIVSTSVNIRGNLHLITICLYFVFLKIGDYTN